MSPGPGLMDAWSGTIHIAERGTRNPGRCIRPWVWTQSGKRIATEAAVEAIRDVNRTADKRTESLVLAV